MKIRRVSESLDTLLDPQAPVWNGANGREFPMVATPLKENPAIRRISPFLAKSTDHGRINRLTAAGVHNGEELAIRVMWQSDCHDKLIDLDQFVDGVAVMFPLSTDASAFTMGSEGKPVNAWYWKANLERVGFDVIAEGYGTSVRRNGADSRVRVGALYADGAWHVVLCRPFDVGAGYARFRSGEATRVAFAVWDGGNRERAGRKSFSGDFVTAEVDA